jgi:hypothetical protein
MNLIKYWKECLFFSVYLTILLYCKSSDITLMNSGNDCFSFLYGTRFLESLYPSPLYTLLGYPIANLPFGIDGGNLVLFLSVIPAWLSSIFVFLSLRKISDNKIAPWIGSSMLAGSYMYFSQAVIVEVYALMSCLFALSFLLLSYKKYSWSSVVMGLAMCTHYVTCFIPFVAFLIWNKEFRKKWYLAIIVCMMIAIPYYLFVNKFYWSGDSSFIDSFYSTVSIMVYQMSRGFSGLGHIFAIIMTFGLSLIPILLFSRDIKKSGLFLVMLLFPSLYFFIGRADYMFVQFVPFAPYYAIMAGLGISYIKTNHLDKFILSGSLLMMLSLPFVFNMNVINSVADDEKLVIVSDAFTLPLGSLYVDNSVTTAREAIDQLDKVEDGSIVVCIRVLIDDEGDWMSDSLGGHVSTIVEYYNRLNYKHLVPFDPNFIGRNVYSSLLNKVASHEVNIPSEYYKSEGESEAMSETQRIKKLLLSISESNPNKHIYYYRIVDNQSEECELVKIQ